MWTYVWWWWDGKILNVILKGSIIKIEKFLFSSSSAQHLYFLTFHTHIYTDFHMTSFHFKLTWKQRAWITFFFVVDILSPLFTPHFLFSIFSLTLSSIFYALYYIFKVNNVRTYTYIHPKVMILCWLKKEWNFLRK